MGHLYNDLAKYVLLESNSKSNNLIHDLALKFDILITIVPRLIYMGTTLSQPFLIQSMIRFVENAQHDTNPDSGYGLIAAFALNYSLMAICDGWYYQGLAIFSTKLRSCLVSLIYHHTLYIQAKDADVGAGTVLMNVDVELVMLGSTLLHEFWTLLVTCCIALYILYTQLGIAFLAPTFMSVVMVVGCYHLGKSMKPRQLKWTQLVEKRVVSISLAVSNMKSIRMLGLTKAVHQYLTQLREDDVAMNM